MDWQKIVLDLEAAGMRQTEIAALVGCAQPTISELKRGLKGAGYDTGTALVALWKRRCGKGRKPPVKPEQRQEAAA